MLPARGFRKRTGPEVCEADETALFPQHGHQAHQEEQGRRQVHHGCAAQRPPIPRQVQHGARSDDRQFGEADQGILAEASQRTVQQQKEQGKLREEQER
jgi:hypothetical protein